ncbi:MAG: ADP-ribosylation factor-directed GTPase activating protein isoform b, partial [Planctomycetota bacterium]
MRFSPVRSGSSAKLARRQFLAGAIGFPLLAGPIMGGLIATTGCGPDEPKPGTGDSSAKSPTVSSDALPGDDELKQMLDEELEFACLGRRLNLKNHAAWQIVHGALAFGHDFLITDNDGKDVSALAYLLAGGRMTGWTMETGVPLGDPARPGLRAIVESGSKTGQGHADQWLGYLADVGRKLDQEIKAAAREFTIEDYLRQVEYDVPNNVQQEYSWTIMALTAYRPTNHRWMASDGKEWSTERLVEIELGHDLAVSACGGSHRMTGITMAFNQHVRNGGKIEGVWKKADEKIRDCVARAKRFQNPDGSLSSNYFQRTGQSKDLGEQLGSSGHVLEFVVVASTDEQLKEPWL